MNYTELVAAVQDYTENTFPTADINTMIKIAEQTIYNTVQLATLRKNVTGTLSLGNKYLSCPGDFMSTYSIAVITGYGTASEEYHYLLNKDVNFIREAYPGTGTAYRGLPKHYAIFGPTYGNEAELSFIVGPTPDAAYYVELHYYYYPESIVQGQLSTVSIAGGSGFSNGTYRNVSLISLTSNGAGAKATIVVSGGSVTSVTVTESGSGYSVGDTLTVTYGTLGTGGIGFVATVATVLNSTGTSWLGDNFDSALFNGTMMEAIRYMKGEPDLVAMYKEQFLQSLTLLKNLGDGKQRMDAYRDGQVRNPVA